jgi:hypothetical protein
MVMVADGRMQGKDSNLSLVHVSDAPVLPGAQQNVQKVPQLVCFDRQELAQILSVYGRKVGQGEWRDYAMDFLKDRAVFSAFARNSERPLFTIEKSPWLRNRQGQYMVTNQQGRIVKRGHELRQVLKVFDPQLSVVT